MPAFLISTVRVTDPEPFKAYVDMIAGLAEEHGGEYLVRGPVTAVLEGDAPEGERAVVLRFPDESSARGYIESPRYAAGKKLREGAAQVSLRLVVA